MSKPKLYEVHGYGHIETMWRGESWRAFVKGDRARWEDGKTESEAMGKLVMSLKEELWPQVPDKALAELRQKAEAATPREWELAEAGPMKLHDRYRFIRSTQDGTEHGAVAVVPLGSANAGFIAAASPAVVMVLVDEVARLRMEVAEMRKRAERHAREEALFNETSTLLAQGKIAAEEARDAALVEVEILRRSTTRTP